MKQQTRQMLKFSESHQDQGKRNILCEIFVNPLARHQRAAVNVAEHNFRRAAEVYYTGTQKNEKQRKKSCIERCDPHVLLPLGPSSVRTFAELRAELTVLEVNLKTGGYYEEN